MSPSHTHGADPYWDDHLMAPRFAIAKPVQESHSDSTMLMPLPRPWPAESQQKGRSRHRNFHFSVISNPTKPTPAQEMKAIRKHVMKDFVSISGGDPRAKRQRLEGRSKTSRKCVVDDQTRSQSSNDSKSFTSTPVLGKLSIAQRQTAMAIDLARSQPNNNGSTRCSTESQLQPQQELAMTKGSARAQAVQPATDQAIVWSGASNVLYRPVTSCGTQTLYMATGIQELLLQHNGVTGKIDPFKSWPAFCHPEVEVERLKWLCTVFRHPSRRQLTDKLIIR